MYEFVPGHIAGRNFQTYLDPKETLEMDNLDLGGYIRISTHKETQLSSIDNQKRLLYEWAELNGHNLIKVYVDIKSGEYTYQRDELKEMLEDIKKGVIRGVVVKEISRTSRDVMDMLELKRKIAHLGGFIISLKESYDSRRDDDEFLLILYSALAQKERRTTSGRVKITQLIKAKEGKTNVPVPALGYKLSEDRQTLVINEDTAPVVRFIFDKYLEGWGQLKIAKYLNEKGIKTRRGAEWCTNAIRTILSNPVYLGITIYNATRLLRSPDGTQKRVIRPFEEWIVREKTHEPLVTEDEFRRVQLIMQQHKEKDTKEWSCDRKYLGSGILFCGECGGKIYGSRYPKKVKGQKSGDSYYYRYRCDGRNGKCSPPMKYWNMERVDNMILNVFKSLFEDNKKLANALRSQLTQFNEDSMQIEKREQLKRRIDEIERAIKRQFEAYESGAIELDEYKERMAELRHERQKLLNEIEKITQQLSKLDTLNDRLEHIFKQIREKLDDIHYLPLEEKSALLNATFRQIYLNSDYHIKEIIFNT